MISQNENPLPEEELGEAQSKKPRDYAHMRDEEAQRTRWELWLVIAIVAVVVIGGLIWRVATGRHAGPQVGWSPKDAGFKASLPAGASLPNRGAPPSP